MEKIDNQDEYELSIAIPDDYNIYKSASIKAKIQLIRSYYKYFQDLSLKTENNLNNYEMSLKESQKLFDNLNEPFGFFGQLNNSEEFKKFNNPHQSGGSVDSGTSRSNSEMVHFQIKVADNIENFLKTTFSI